MAETIRPLTLSQVRAIYVQRMREDFPPDEMKPLARIEELLSEGLYACCGWFDGDRMPAYAFFDVFENSALLDYFAVEKSMRDQGLGSRFLRALIEGPLKDKDCALLEVEDPDCAADAEEKALRLRRLGFYMRNGMIDTGVRATAFHVTFKLLSLPVGRVPVGQAARRAYASIYRAILPGDLYAKMVRIEAE